MNNPARVSRDDQNNNHDQNMDSGESSVVNKPLPTTKNGNVVKNIFIGFGLFGFLFSVAALILCWAAQQEKTRQKEALRAIEQRFSLVPNNTELMTNLGSLRQSIDEAKQAQKENQNTLHSELVASNEDLEALSKQVQELRVLATSGKDAWRHAEVEYLLEIGNQQALIVHDISTAIAALESADDLLQELDQVRYAQVRKILAAELVALQAIPPTNREAVASRLLDLTGKVKNWPRRDTHPENYTASKNNTALSEGSYWRRISNAIGSALGDVVRIERSDADTPPLLAPEQEFFLTRNLELQFSSARQAFLLGDEANFLASLKLAKAWLTTYFQSEDPEIQNAIATINQLEGTPVVIELPDIGESLEKMRAISLGLKE